MPLTRLSRTRRSLPEGYQFGDAARARPIVLTGGARMLTQAEQREIAKAIGGGLPLMLPAGFSLAGNQYATATGSPHRADTLDPDGYGHAV